MEFIGKSRVEENVVACGIGSLLALVRAAVQVQ
jgi:hypothetical protein